MTTIAWDGTTLAADRCSWNSNGSKRAVNKLHRFEDGIFAACGDGAFIEAYVAYRQGKRAMPDYKEYDIDKSSVFGLLISNEGLVFGITNLGELVTYEEEIFALGGGQAFAWGALEAGATAKQAVEIAAKRSDYAAFGVDEMTLHA